MWVRVGLYKLMLNWEMGHSFVTQWVTQAARRCVGGHVRVKCIGRLVPTEEVLLALGPQT